MGWPHYIGVKDASIHGIGGIIMGEGKVCTPTVFCLAWPDDIKELFHKGNITNLDLEIAVLLMLWLLMEEVCPELRAAYVLLFSVNSPTRRQGCIYPWNWVYHNGRGKSMHSNSVLPCLAR